MRMSSNSYGLNLYSILIYNRKGLSVWQASFTVKQYRSHRRIRPIVDVLDALETHEHQPMIVPTSTSDFTDHP